MKREFTANWETGKARMFGLKFTLPDKICNGFIPFNKLVEKIGKNKSEIVEIFSENGIFKTVGYGIDQEYAVDESSIEDFTGPDGDVIKNRDPIIFACVQSETGGILFSEELFVPLYQKLIDEKELNKMFFKITDAIRYEKTVSGLCEFIAGRFIHYWKLAVTGKDLGEEYTIPLSGFIKEYVERRPGIDKEDLWKEFKKKYAIPYVELFKEDNQHPTGMRY